MALIFLDSEMNELADTPLRTTHEGFVGGEDQIMFFIRNRDRSVFYRNIFIKPKFNNDYYKYEDFDISNWSIKLKYGSKQPTEEEWDAIENGSGLVLPDIGSIESADSFTNHPIWMRVYCPGGTSAQVKENMFLEIEYKEEKVRE